MQDNIDDRFFCRFQLNPVNSGISIPGKIPVSDLFRDDGTSARKYYKEKKYRKKFHINFFRQITKKLRNDQRI